jgi:hypothetical protein
MPALNRGYTRMALNCAAIWGAEIFVSADQQQLAAARKAGLKVKAARTRITRG